METREPRTDEEFEEYFDLRWRVLRAPWGQPRGSERDEMEDKSIHMIFVEEERILGVGRGHINSEVEGQIRYMAVDGNQKGRGIGRKILEELERRVAERGVRYVVLNSREEAVDFYRKQGYQVIGEAPTMFGVIRHFKMKKDL